MKKITLILITLFATGTMLMAQGGPRNGQRGEQRNVDPKERAERMTERMAKAYSLNDEQKKQMYAVNLEMTQKMTPPQKTDVAKEAKKDAKVKDKSKDKKGKNAHHRKSGKMDNRPSKEHREKMMAQMKQSREDYEAKIQKIFTKEQYETYTQKQAERQKRMGERGSRPQRTNS